MRSGDEEEEEKEEQEDEKEEATNIKSNNPHLAGREKQNMSIENSIKKTTRKFHEFPDFR